MIFDLLHDFSDGSIFTWTYWPEPFKLYFFGCVSFWFVSAVALYLDRCIDPKSPLGKLLWHEYKIQGIKARLTDEQLWDIFLVAFRNMMVIGPILAGLVHLFTLHVFNSRTMQESDPFSWPREIACFIVQEVIVDMWFYWIHRLFHTKRFYASIHKMHHKYTAPNCMATVYAHPIEFVFNNTAGVAVGPFVTNCHPYTAYAWYAYNLVSTSLVHSGFRMFGIAEQHDAHHEFFHYELGNHVTDWMFGTQLPKNIQESLNRRQREQRGAVKRLMRKSM